MLTCNPKTPPIICWLWQALWFWHWCKCFPSCRIPRTGHWPPKQRCLEPHLGLWLCGNRWQKADCLCTRICSTGRKEEPSGSSICSVHCWFFPVTLISGPVAAYNAGLLIQWALCGVGMYALAWRVTGSMAGAWAAGICCLALYRTSWAKPTTGFQKRSLRDGCRWHCWVCAKSSSIQAAETASWVACCSGLSALANWYYGAVCGHGSDWAVYPFVLAQTKDDCLALCLVAWNVV